MTGPAPLLDVAAAAERLGTTVTHMRRLVYERRITFIKVGGKVRFKPADLEAWVEAQTVEAAP